MFLLFFKFLIWYPRSDLNRELYGSEPFASASSATRIDFTDFVARASAPPNNDVIAFQHLVWASPTPSRELVDRVGADPTIPEGVGFTVRCSCRFATYP